MYRPTFHSTVHPTSELVYYPNNKTLSLYVSILFTVSYYFHGIILIKIPFRKYIFSCDLKFNCFYNLPPKIIQTHLIHLTHISDIWMRNVGLLYKISIISAHSIIFIFQLCILIPIFISFAHLIMLLLLENYQQSVYYHTWCRYS